MTVMTAKLETMKPCRALLPLLEVHCGTLLIAGRSEEPDDLGMARHLDYLVMVLHHICVIVTTLMPSLGISPGLGIVGPLRPGHVLLVILASKEIKINTSKPRYFVVLMAGIKQTPLQATRVTMQKM